MMLDAVCYHLCPVWKSVSDCVLHYCTVQYHTLYSVQCPGSHTANITSSSTPRCLDNKLGLKLKYDLEDR